MTYLYVFIGGGLGACLRYAIGLVYPQHLIWGLPTKTWIANVLGSLLVAIAFSVQKNLPQQSLVEAMVVIGFCGGLTTFSTYILEAYHFILHKKSGSSPDLKI